MSSLRPVSTHSDISARPTSSMVGEGWEGGRASLVKVSREGGREGGEMRF